MKKVHIGIVIFYLNVLILIYITFSDVKNYFSIFTITIILLVIENIINDFIMLKKAKFEGKQIENRINKGYKIFAIEKELMGNYNVAAVGTLNPVIFTEHTVHSKLSRDEFDCVVAHEIGHIENKHGLKNFLLKYISLATMCCGLHLVIFTHSTVAYVVCILGIFLTILKYMYMHKAEYIADEFAIKNMEDANNFEEGLRKIAKLNYSNKKGITTITHPNFEKRINTIKKKLV